MTSACIVKDTWRIDTQVLLKFRNSIFEICLHLIKSNCNSDFLPSLMQTSSAGTSKEIPLHDCGLSLPAMLITLSFSFFEFSYSIEKFIQPRLLKSTCHPTRQSIRSILMCSLSNKYPRSPVRNGIIHRKSSTRLKYRTLIQRECRQFPRSHPQNLNF